MKSSIASALAVVACVATLAACSGKGSSGAGGTAPASDSQRVAANPDGDLSSIDQQLSGIDGALTSAEPTQASGDTG